MSARLHRGEWTVFVVLLVVAAGLRVLLALQPGLWADELFSLAMATGHSLEHPAAAADPTRGDYVEPRDAQPAAAFQRYLNHETPPAGFRRVIRAVQLSDTSPPLYYLMLDLWLRLGGTSDASLRLFSTACALLALGLLWSVGRAIGGVPVATVACLLFTFAPPSLYYAGEGRMYALTWLLGLALVRLTLALAREAARPAVVVGWILVAAAGLLTHYFFAFVWLATLIWLSVHADGLRWRSLAAMTGAVGLLIVPWYAQLPASLSAWRVTGGWLDTPLSLGELAFGVARLGMSFVNPRGVWSGAKPQMWSLLAMYLVLAAAVLQNGVRPLLSPARQLPWLWLLASVLGPIVFDLLRGTATARVERYALPGLPAAMLVLALATNHVARPIGVAVLAATLLTWLPGIRDVWYASPRAWEPYPIIAANVEGWTAPEDLVIVNSIPSGVLGVARYVDPQTPIASWVVQLGVRQMPADAEALATGRCRIALVRTHNMGEDAPVESWLHANMKFEREAQLRDREGRETSSAIVYFVKAERDDRCSSHAASFHGRASNDPGTPSRPATHTGG